MRDKLGGFKALEDLRQVSGIGEKTLEKLKDDIFLD
ncbi:comE operon 1 domain-containing protein [Streptococcus pyogenes]|nr:comE operon 1 domain-containing protein [Streptococcus pyogenes]VHD59226.1 comE operon 1 domain-containing protein [Streptococcus pyogenes]VHD87076.1 comE operon 1 domain-containing protein [Streptococcus pyogenes]